jgi:hypothetical protein
MVEIRTFRLGNGGSVVALRGDLGAEAAAELAAEIGRAPRSGGVIVDLVRARLIDDSVVEALVVGLHGDVTYVAERPLLDVLLPVAPASVSTLTAALDA